ncbi:hypothetical protein BAE44_0000045 [Dichanthelium oligosanthes]|uniref:Uncharacterized protein n=1 Tax=Dichanthelium oligosanthes TaxID=888268 RepID=A0A1E5WNF9_9POAL|nr:hypothetical protein BAE44_0000045 [Dichanthelium oligosanthes]
MTLSPNGAAGMGIRLRRGARHGPVPPSHPTQLYLLSALPHRSLDALSKRHGPLMRVQFGSFPVAIASSIDMGQVLPQDPQLGVH